MSTAVSIEPLGSTQQLRWVAVELTALTLWFRLAFIRHDNVCFVWFHAYVRTWFANNHNRFGGGGWGWRERMTIICNKLRTSTVDYQFSFYSSSERSTPSCVRWRIPKERVFFKSILCFFFWVCSQKPRTWNRRSVCRSWRAARGLAVPQMTPRSERSARDPAHQASVLSQV